MSELELRFVLERTAIAAQPALSLHLKLEEGAGVGGEGQLKRLLVLALPTGSEQVGAVEGDRPMRWFRWVGRWEEGLLGVVGLLLPELPSNPESPQLHSREQT